MHKMYYVSGVCLNLIKRNVKYPEAVEGATFNQILVNLLLLFEHVCVILNLCGSNP